MKAEEEQEDDAKEGRKEGRKERCKFLSRCAAEKWANSGIKWPLLSACLPAWRKNDAEPSLRVIEEGASHRISSPRPLVRLLVYLHAQGNIQNYAISASEL